mmetsp:Transcript_7212/g.21988  ORF Transcript_7212/g.21988 Transcript_7212/m.21988 type:complete len:325 (+) Transcript_7212:51-1025(+)
MKMGTHSAFVPCGFRTKDVSSGRATRAQRPGRWKCMRAEKDGRRVVQVATPEDAKKVFREVATEFVGGEVGLLERMGESSATAIAETFPAQVNPMGIVMCGPGTNGAVGFHTAVALSKRGYDVTVMACESNSKFTEEDVRRFGMKYIEFVPGPIDALYDFYVDAMLGLGYDNGPLGEPYRTIIEKIANSEKPTVSLDVPTGWHLNRGPKDEDLWRGTALKPDLLLSLGVPKAGALRFGGAFHYVVGNCIPKEKLDNIDVELPSFPKGSDIVLASGNPALFGWGKKTGQVYGKEGALMATLYPGMQSRRKWVDIDEDPNLWDELD